MKYKIVVAVEGQFAEIDNNPVTKTKIMRTYEIEVKNEKEAFDKSLALRNNVYAEAEILGEISVKYDPHVERMV